jgi:diaminohydroxyphosphoribosylaminopyrimidine deaminase / 5-amino-6-(5-phosphoribosylamino)uracil reductase
MNRALKKRQKNQRFEKPTLRKTNASMPKARQKNLRPTLHEHESFMRQCLRLARRGAGATSPNPMVGAVVVHRGTVIGRGWHRRFGEAHAEVNAINAVKNPALLRESTLYVNLEPCSHFGKTPPCADLIIEKKIPRVVVGCRDPFKKVAGKGVKKLRDAGVKVSVGILEAESRQLNEAFIKFHSQHTPLVALKLAQTLDGKIATRTKDSKWITSESARAYAHSLRAEYDAVLVGTGTALADNPALTVRMVKGRHPKRILLDRKLRVPLNAKIFDGDATTIVFTSKVNRKHPKVSALERKGVMTRFVGEKNDELNLNDVLSQLYEENILSVMVEGGAKIFAGFLKARLCDKLHAFVAPKFVGADGLSGIGALGFTHIDESVALHSLTLKLLDETLLIEGYFENSVY